MTQSYARGPLTPRDANSHPPACHPEYKSSILRSPTQPLILLDERLKNRQVPVYGADDLGRLDHDLTANAVRNGSPLGERIIVTGQVRDEYDRPVPGTLVEIWQANASGRYVHQGDQHDAPLDPNFLGAGRCLTDNEGRYRFVTVKPGAYPWGNHPNAWRPNHIHFSVFGPQWGTRLVTQMYFPGDPLLALDPIFHSVPQGARDRLVAQFSLAHTQEGVALGFVFDIVLRGARQTPMEAS